MHLIADEKRRLLARLRGAEGQVSAIRRMIDSEEHCARGLTRIASAGGALGTVGEAVPQLHADPIVSEASGTGDAAALAEDLVETFRRYGGMGRS